MPAACTATDLLCRICNALTFVRGKKRLVLFSDGWLSNLIRCETFNAFNSRRCEKWQERTFKVTFNTFVVHLCVRTSVVRVINWISCFHIYNWTLLLHTRHRIEIESIRCLAHQKIEQWSTRKIEYDTENVSKFRNGNFVRVLTCVNTFFLLWRRKLFRFEFIPGENFAKIMPDSRISVESFKTVFYHVLAMRIAIVYFFFLLLFAVWNEQLSLIFQFTRLRSDNKNKNGCCTNTFNWHHDGAKRRARDRKRSASHSKRH